AGVRDGDLDAERMCDGPLTEVGDRVRDPRNPRVALARRAGRRDGARADARDQSRRDGHDARQLLRHAGLDDRPVCAVLRRQLRRRRRGARHHDRGAGLGARVRAVLRAVADALALSRVRRRPWIGRADRAPQRAVLGAAEDQRHDRAGAQPGPAPGRRHERLLHPAGQDEGIADEPVRRPPAARAASGRARAPGGTAARRRLTVGLRDILTGRHQVKGPAPDRLFAISTAYVMLQSEHQIEPTGTAAIVFQALATSEFEATLRDMEAVVTATGTDSGTTVSTQDDSYGYRWMILRNPTGAPSVEDLAVGINAVSGSIESAGHGERLLCAVFAFADAQKRSIYFIYNYKRGFWYPSAPAPGAAKEPSPERELQLKAQMAGELP